MVSVCIGISGLVQQLDAPLKELSTRRKWSSFDMCMVGEESSYVRIIQLTLYPSICHGSEGSSSKIRMYINQGNIVPHINSHSSFKCTDICNFFMHLILQCSFEIITTV
jgi:hypothetical protein